MLKKKSFSSRITYSVKDAFSALSCCKSNIYFRLMQIFEEKKCILKAEMLKKKSFSSRITYSVKDVNVYI